MKTLDQKKKKKKGRKVSKKWGSASQWTKA